MARRTRGAFSGRQSARRATGWDIGPEGILSPASTAVSGFPTTVLSLLDGQTIVRTRGELYLRLLSSSTAQGGFQWAAGLCIVSSKAAAIGATAIPGPLTEIEWEGWFWHSQGAIKTGGPVPVDSITSVDLVQRVEIDSKAMRKIDSEETIVGMLETVEVGTSTMHAELRTRILSKLP